MVKTNIPERTTEMRMQSELHRDLWGGHWVERAGAGSFMKSARVRMCLAVLASGSFSVEGKWVGCACVPGSCDGRGVNKGFGAGSHSVHSLSLHCQPLGQAHSALVVTVQFRMR